MSPGRDSRGWISSWLDQVMGLIGGWLGCCGKPFFTMSVDELSKGSMIQGVKTSGALSDGLWSTSTFELENNYALQSQRNIPSMSGYAQGNDVCLNGNASHTKNLTVNDFVNHGLTVWNQTRKDWTRFNDPPDGHSTQADADSRSRSWRSWNSTYESMMGSGRPFPRPLPLSEVVEFMVDTWDEEGLYG
ncbi:uncharacterized protein LOC144703960 isoform X2 [Wolffia australiana]